MIECKGVIKIDKYIKGADRLVENEAFVELVDTESGLVAALVPATHIEMVYNAVKRWHEDGNADDFAESQEEQPTVDADANTTVLQAPADLTPEGLGLVQGDLEQFGNVDNTVLEATAEPTVSDTDADPHGDPFAAPDGTVPPEEETETVPAPEEGSVAVPGTTTL